MPLGPKMSAYGRTSETLGTAFSAWATEYVWARLTTAGLTAVLQYAPGGAVSGWVRTEATKT